MGEEAGQASAQEPALGLDPGDRDARWTVKFTKAKPREDGTMPAVDLAIPAFGYRNHIAIDRRFGLIRTWLATDAAAHEGSRLREDVLDKTNTASTVWGDTAYPSAANEDQLTQVFAPALRDPEQLRLASRRRLARHQAKPSQAKPSGEVAAWAERAPVADRGDQRRRVHHSDARDHAG